MRNPRNSDSGSRAAAYTAIGTIVVALIAGGVKLYLGREHTTKETVDYTGHVFDESGNAVPGAVVTLEIDQKVPSVVYTDTQGVFHTMLSPETKSLRVRVSATGFAAFDRNVSVSRTGLEEIRLEKLASRPPPHSSGSSQHVGEDWNQKVVALKGEITNLCGDFENIATYGDPPRMKVNEWAPRRADEMLAVPDQHLALTHQITKYEYACYALMMAAATEENLRDRLSYADRSIDAGEKTLRLVDAAKDATDPISKAASSWATAANTKPRVNYLLAIDYCIKWKNDKNQTWKTKVSELIGDIPRYYKEMTPPEKNPDLAECMR